MKRLGLIVALAALLVPVAAPASTAPRLRIVVDSPLVVQGTGFKPGERVKVTAFGQQGSLVRRIVATRAGTFGARFATSAADWCNDVREIRAAGLRGSKAEVWVKPAGRECAAP